MTPSLVTQSVSERREALLLNVMSEHWLLLAMPVPPSTIAG